MMKSKKIISSTSKAIIWLTIICINTLIIPAQTIRKISKETALALVKSDFTETDCNYYLIEDSNATELTSDTWNIFVDPSPLKGWAHECYIYSVAKATTTGLKPALTILERKFPPNGKLTALDIHNFYGDNSDDYPNLPIKNSFPADTTNGGKTYAIILSGGKNEVSNRKRYWNDCSFIYQSLLKTYNVPKENIFLIMADGDDDKVDYMDDVTHQYLSSSTDLDFDGIPDLKMAATKENIWYAFETLKYWVKKNDQVFIYVIDHGGFDEEKDQSYICLWQNQRLYPEELSNYISPLLDKGVVLNVILGQCNSGGFINSLSNIGCVVATACKETESSFGCTNIPYDEFVYHWTSAINKETPYGELVDADFDNDGHISMQEAFDYAKSKDIFTNARPIIPPVLTADAPESNNSNISDIYPTKNTTETPLYCSTPESLGEDLSLDKIPSSYELYIKKGIDDTGKIPYLSSSCLWDSPSIWIRNEDDGGLIHEDPYYSSDHTKVWVYVRVNHRGWTPYIAGCMVKLYCAKASTSKNFNIWDGKDKDGNEATGYYIGSKALNTTKPGEEKIVKFSWELPVNLADIDEKDSSHQYTLMATIYDFKEDKTDKEKWIDLIWNNNAAQKSTTVLYAKNSSTTVKSYFRNLNNAQEVFTLRLIPLGKQEEQLLKEQRIYIDLSPSLLTAWTRGGGEMKGMIHNMTSTPRRFTPYLSTASLSNLLLEGATIGYVNIGAKFPPATISTESKNYIFDLVQETKNGESIGGERIRIKSPGLSSMPININTKQTFDGKIELSIDNVNSQEAVWYCEEEEIGVGASVQTSLGKESKEYSVIIPIDEDYVAVGHTVIQTCLKGINLDSTGKHIDAKFIEDIDLNNVTVTINRIDNLFIWNDVKAEIIDSNAIRISTEYLNEGFYQILFHQGTNLIASSRFRIVK